VLDRMHGRLSGIGEHVATRAARFARRRAADVIVCGHTHEPIHRRFPCPADGPTVDYWNAGAWVGRPSTFLAVDPSGVRLERRH
jgi:UDP-2,3-diacylglucosamine pyrophosphatase LpxH